MFTEAGENKWAQPLVFWDGENKRDGRRFSGTRFQRFFRGLPGFPGSRQPRQPIVRAIHRSVPLQPVVKVPRADAPWIRAGIEASRRSSPGAPGRASLDNEEPGPKPQAAAARLEPRADTGGPRQRSDGWRPLPPRSAADSSSLSNSSGGLAGHLTQRHLQFRRQRRLPASAKRVTPGQDGSLRTSSLRWQFPFRRAGAEVRGLGNPPLTLGMRRELRSDPGPRVPGLA